MLLTEEEAKTKWCPFARASFSAGSFNRWTFEGKNKDCFCIASQCMAWRYGPVCYVTEDGQQGRGGYCGLAGKLGA